MDYMVLAAQQLVNSYIDRGVLQEPSGYRLDENGVTGWDVVYGLIRVLQYELGISVLADAFGPATMSALTSRYPVIDADHGTTAVWKVVQAGLYCKGYPGGQANGLPGSYQFVGDYDSEVAASVSSLKSDIGVASVYPGSGLQPKAFQCLLNTDPYITTGDGTAALTSACRWLNSRYIAHSSYTASPCDGSPSRGVQEALMLGIQYELGLSDDDATGNFGPTTQQGLRNHTLGTGSTGTWVGFLRTGMLMNRRSGVSFSTTFDSTLAGQVESFQSFSALTVNGTADYPTWASLLVSYGDTSRVGKGADCSTQLVAADLAALNSRGVSIVGRYLSTVPGSGFEKQLGDDEPGYFHDAAVSIFPIFETSGSYLDYFTASQGRIDALSALGWLNYYGFVAGTTVYFAVDYDMMEDQVTSNVIPYFQSIVSVFGSRGDTYRIGAYGARHVCQMLADKSLSTSSYVLDMSSGYSGNLGYPLPDNWAFDQISGFSLSAGGRSVNYDNVIVSGRDTGN